jgi:hypothetical protein
MTSRENRARIRDERRAAGGETAARQQLLDATPPLERSEVAAVWDHQREVDRLDPSDPEIRDFVRADLERCQLIQLIDELAGDSGPYDVSYILVRLNRGLRLADKAEAIVEAARARARQHPVSEAEVAAEAGRYVAERRAYIAKRYGVV